MGKGPERLEAQGVWLFDGPDDIRADLENFDLAVLKILYPEQAPDFSGGVDLHFEFRGDLDKEPTIVAEGTLTDLNLSELCDEMAELFEPACEDAGITFSAEIAPGLEVMGDRSLLAQAIANLLDNAVKYTPSGERIHFNAELYEEQIEVSIADTGPGIPMESLERVKERFVRLDDARTQVGSGLGLALVDAVAELHKASFELTRGDGDIGLKAILTFTPTR